MVETITVKEWAKRPAANQPVYLVRVRLRLRLRLRLSPTLISAASQPVYVPFVAWRDALRKPSRQDHLPHLVRARASARARARARVGGASNLLWLYLLRPYLLGDAR